MVKLHLSKKIMNARRVFHLQLNISWFERELWFSSICGMSLVVLWVTLYLVFCLTDYCLRYFNGAPSLSVHGELFSLLSALCWTCTVRNHRLCFLPQKVLCCFAVSIPCDDYQVFDCLSALLLRLAAAMITGTLSMMCFRCHQLSKDATIFILTVLLLLVFVNLTFFCL